MDNEVIEFQAGLDTFGLRRWVPGLVLGREDRDDGVWVNVLPANSESDSDSCWVQDTDIRPART
jgi:hypothetical protein